MPKPQLPPEIAARFSPDVVALIQSFVPYPKKKPTAHSPQLAADLRRIQNTVLRGKTETYLRDLEDFMLE